MFDGGQRCMPPNWASRSSSTSSAHSSSFTSSPWLDLVPHRRASHAQSCATEGKAPEREGPSGGDREPNSRSASPHHRGDRPRPSPFARPPPPPSHPRGRPVDLESHVEKNQKGKSSHE